MEEQEIEIEKKIEKKAEKIVNWLKKPDNLLLIGILLFALIIRIYYFILTKNQPLWWDEGEYGLKAKAFAFGTPLTGWYGAREVFVPFIFSLILRLGGTEVSWRILQLVISFMTVLFVYFLGKEMFNKRTALIATLIIAVNGIHLFFTGRILTYLWAPLFFLLTFYLFYKGYVKQEDNKNRKKFLYAFPVVAALGLSVYGSLAFGLLAIVLFLFITEGFNFLKKKEIWIMALIGFLCLVPQFIYSKIVYGAFVGRWAGLQSSKPPSDFSLLFGYFKMFPHLFGWIFTILITLGAVYIIMLLFTSLDLLSKNKSKTLNSYLLIFLWALCVLGFYTYVGVGWGVLYDGFILSSLPALALMVSGLISFISSLKIKKRLIFFVLLIILAFGAYSQINYGNNLIKGKINSFDGVKYAGEWIKENSNPGDIIISSSLPQMTYYSERETYPFLRHTPVADDLTVRTTEEEFKKFVEEKKPRYIIDSIFEYVPEWVHQYPVKYNATLIPVQGYFLDEAKTQISLIIYEVKY